MKKLSTAKRAEIVRALVEGNSIRATVRMTGVSKGAVLKFLEDIGRVCADYQDATLRDLTCRRIQCDEAWAFIGMKEKQAKGKGADRPKGVGDIWTWVAIDADTKLVPTWRIGGRDAGVAYDFMMDLKERLANRVQLTTDGHKAYLSAVGDAFGMDIDYAQLVKVYGEATKEDQRKYSPAECIGCECQKITGNPDMNHVSTSYVERQNLTLRMSMRRYTRLTNAFSRKAENLACAVALHFMWYNFGRIHQTLRCTPAQEAGVSKHIWTAEEIVGLLEAKEAADAADKVEREGRVVGLR